MQQSHCEYGTTWGKFGLAMIQSQEERDHALLFLKYIQNNGLKVTLEAIGKPDKVFEGVLDSLVIAAERRCLLNKTKPFY